MVEDEVGICGYALAAVDCKQFEQKKHIAWLPELIQKYSKPISAASECDSSQILIKKFSELVKMGADNTRAPDWVLKSHPSVIRIDLLNHVTDASVAKRLLAVALAALKANGSTGVYARGNPSCKPFIEHYTKLGFQQITRPPSATTVVITNTAPIPTAAAPTPPTTVSSLDNAASNSSSSLASTSRSNSLVGGGGSTISAPTKEAIVSNDFETFFTRVF